MPEFKSEPFVLKTPFDSIGAIVRSVTARLDFKTEESISGYIKANKIENSKVVRASKSVHFVLTIEWKNVSPPSYERTDIPPDPELEENWPDVRITVHVKEEKNEWTTRNCQLLVREACDFIKQDYHRWYESKQMAKQNTQFGNARWATEDELLDYGFLTIQDAPDRFIAGEYRTEERYFHVTIPPADSERHTLVCGPTGCGKTATVFTPNLLFRKEASAIVTEATPGGKVPDLFSKTARYRQEAGHQIYYFNPDDRRSTRINPVDIVKTVSNAQDLADILIRNTTLNSHAGDQVWETSERQMLTALIMIAASQKGTLTDVRKMLLMGQKQLKKEVEQMKPSIGRDECLGMFNLSTEGFLNGVMVGLMVRLSPWLNPQIAALTAKTDFKINKLPDELFTFYLAVPSGKRQVKPVSALIMNFLLDVILEQLRHRDRFPRPFMMLLDELTNFGYIPDLAGQLTIMRHAHVPMVLGMQDTEQLRKVYGMQDAKIILSQPATRIFFKPNDLTTAREISQQLGRGTKHEQTRNGDFRFYGRDLMMPDEIMSLSKKRAVCFLPEGKPMLLDKLSPEQLDAMIVRDPPFRKPVKVNEDLVLPVETPESIKAKKQAKKEYPKLFEEPAPAKNEEILLQQNEARNKKGKFRRNRAKEILKNLGIDESELDANVDEEELSQ